MYDDEDVDGFFMELDLPGSLQGTQFDIEMERSHLIDTIVAFMMPAIAMAPLMAAVSLCSIAIDDLNRIFKGE